MDAHDLSPGGVMALVPVLGGHVDRIVVVGCKPATLQDGIGLSPEVSAATQPAVSLVRDVVARELTRLPAAAVRPPMSRGGG
jgi:hydrogenase maturation protease